MGRSKKIIAALLSAAMLISGASGISLNSNTAEAAAKKVTLKLNKTSVSVKKGKTTTLKIVKKNVKKVKSTKWTSNKKKVATVTKKGVVKGVKKGNATIKAVVKYQPKNSKKLKQKTLSCKVTVTEASKKPEQTATPTASPTTAPTIKPYVMTPPANPSNIGEAKEVSIVGGTSDSMTVYDNGSMRPELSSLELIRTEMGLGINLGNTMEATKALGEKDEFTEATDFEEAWGAPRTTQKYIDSIRSYGFNTLRIPVAWSSMVSKDGKYTIDPKMLGRVEEIVNYALNNGMYVIINIHWDYGWWAQYGSPDLSVRENAKKRFRSYWTQISERFKGYSDHLIFESANEEWGPWLNDPINEDGYVVDEDDPTGTKGNLTEQEYYDIPNQENQEFVNIVRNSGGNNAQRHLLIAGINTNITMTSSDKFIMPTDIEENGNSKLSVSVHYYDPIDFCLDWADGTYVYTEKDKEHHVSEFEKMKKFTDAGYGVIVGECGVVVQRQNQVVECLTDMIKVMTEYGCLPVLWDRPDGYFDRVGCKMKYRDVAELFNSLTGSKGDTKIEENTGIPELKSDLVEVPKDIEPVWFWEGTWQKNGGGNIGLDGKKVDKADITKFVIEDNCSDSTMINFNPWGYRTCLSGDIFKDLKTPCIKFTFEEDTNDAVGNVQIANSPDADGVKTVNLEKYSYSLWAKKGIAFSDDLLNGLKENPWFCLTFGNQPRVTGIYVYDLGDIEKE